MVFLNRQADRKLKEKVNFYREVAGPPSHRRVRRGEQEYLASGRARCGVKSLKAMSLLISSRCQERKWQLLFSCTRTYVYKSHNLRMLAVVGGGVEESPADT